MGDKGRTVFWFPCLTLDNDLLQIQFQRNPWALFGVAPNAVAPAPVEAAGGNYRSIFTPNPTTVHVALDDACCHAAGISTTGALVWDWNGMQLVGSVPPGPTLQATLNTGRNASYFLGVRPRTDAVQFVALSGESLGPILDDAAAHRLAVDVYRAMPGQPVTLAVYPGGWSAKGVSVNGATLVSARFDTRNKRFEARVDFKLCARTGPWPGVLSTQVTGRLLVQVAPVDTVYFGLPQALTCTSA